MGGTDSNLRVFDEVADSYTDLALKPAERRLLGLLGHRLHEMEMLDLGVGAGRTSYTFAPLVRRYVGLDQSPRMVAKARELVREDEGAEIVQGDARDLSSAGGPFDLVLFSFNGIDAVGHEDRLKILAQAHRVLRPGGFFQFSSHSLGALPLDPRRERSPQFRGSLLYAAYASLKAIPHRRGVERINRQVDLEAARERGWVIVPEVGHDFQIDDYYIDPEHQVEQLEQLGFSVEAIYDREGRDVTLPFHGRDAWLDYLCRPA
ncbi:MAG TPA: class I SAM-dependent methyltransferase [Solirubrobacterales bacterium]|nr:class I SAM-dependent methyltransferase [Solirubrobacterales bacterium]